MGRARSSSRDSGQRRAQLADSADIRGSTRPGANRVSAATELARVLPVVRELAQAGVTVSIDTMRATVAETAVEAGVPRADPEPPLDHVRTVQRTERPGYPRVRRGARVNRGRLTKLSGPPRPRPLPAPS
ncbi:dihydropteroate synthase [Pseudonocardia sp. Cha107L01]|uniref:dihydropteroate synthase n=1 Tax=Pseudonocardia sp. Cha107L01 TaxID=3457576 RepID=UPI00403ED587